MGAQGPPHRVRQQLNLCTAHCAPPECPLSLDHPPPPPEVLHTHFFSVQHSDCAVLEPISTSSTQLHQGSPPLPKESVCHTARWWILRVLHTLGSAAPLRARSQGSPSISVCVSTQIFPGQAPRQVMSFGEVYPKVLVKHQIR